MFSVENLALEINNRKIFSKVNCDINLEDKIGLVGENGVGKSSLLKIMNGDITPFSGKIIKSNKIDISLMPQDLNQWLDNTIYDFIEEFSGVGDAKKEFEEATNNLKKSPDPKQLLTYEESLSKYDHLGVYDFEKRLHKSLSDAGLKNIDPNIYIGEVSGGQQTRIALAAILTSKKDLILLDEPTNNLDDEGISILEKFIKKSKSSFVIVSHNKKFLNNTTNKIIELLGGDSGVKKYYCNYDEYIEIKNKDHQSELHQYSENLKELRKVKKQIQEKIYEVRSKGYKQKDNAKLNRNFKLEKASRKKSNALQSLKTKYEKIDKISKIEDFPVLDFEFNKQEKINPNSRLITIENLAIEYPNKKIGPINMYVSGKERVLLDGKNGAGKTSIIKAIMGQNNFIKEGYIKLNPSINIGYIDQNQTLPFQDENAIFNLNKLSYNLPLNEVIHLLIKFNIDRESIYNKVSNLSGGERAKIILASVIANHSNIVILDEPTNNLDNTTIDALKNALIPYEGSLLIVSHSDAFIEGLNISRKISI